LTFTSISVSKTLERHRGTVLLGQPFRLKKGAIASQSSDSLLSVNL
jgi:hypothetical protein